MLGHQDSAFCTESGLSVLRPEKETLLGGPFRQGTLIRLLLLEEKLVPYEP